MMDQKLNMYTFSVTRVYTFGPNDHLIYIMSVYFPMHICNDKYIYVYQTLIQRVSDIT